jgi:hypothetical protein
MPITFAALPPAMAVTVSSDFDFAISVASTFDNDLRQYDRIHRYRRMSCPPRRSDGWTCKQRRSRGARQGKVSHPVSSSESNRI